MLKKIKVTHIITGLNMGGAETMLYKLLKHTDLERFDLKVISMMDEGVYGEKIRDLGFEVICLNMKAGIPTINSIKKAKKHLENTDIIQTWMYHADLFGYMLYKLTNAKKLIWGIRRSNLNHKLNKKSTIMVAKINAFLSKRVEVIVSCSIKAKDVHEKFGYSDDNMIVIPNGFELNDFSKKNNSKKQLSNIINKSEDIPYITHVGRWNVLKDHQNLINAISIVKKQGIKFHTILVGTQINNANKELMFMLEENDLLNNVSLLDRRDDIPIIMSGSDVFVSSSIDEGFPNVIGEAMACETPSVVTDAGDSAYVVGNTGIVVPPKNPEALANGIIKLVSTSKEEKHKLGRLARQRVIEKFDIKKVTRKFEQLYNF